MKRTRTIAATRPKSSPSASMQLTSHAYLPCHGLLDSGNMRVVECGMRHPQALHPLPLPSTTSRRCQHSPQVAVLQWLRYHAVEPVAKGRRVSLTLFTPMGMKKLSDDHLEECGFPRQVLTANEVSPLPECFPDEVAVVDLPPDCDHPEERPPLVDESALTPDLWFRGEWDHLTYKVIERVIHPLQCAVTVVAARPPRVMGEVILVVRVQCLMRTECLVDHVADA
eukprot:3060141-Amphidinium_carterae.3